jgi:hypothetical protein
MLASTHTGIPLGELQVARGAEQNGPKLPLQQGWPIPPQVPQDPAMHVIPPSGPQLAPAAAQRLLPNPPVPCTQHPPSRQVLPGQQGCSGPPQRAQTPPDTPPAV